MTFVREDVCAETRPALLTLEPPVWHVPDTSRPTARKDSIPTVRRSPNTISFKPQTIADAPNLLSASESEILHD